MEYIDGLLVNLVVHDFKQISRSIKAYKRLFISIISYEFIANTGFERPRNSR
jgi:hypothetical protein